MIEKGVHYHFMLMPLEMSLAQNYPDWSFGIIGSFKLDYTNKQK